MDEERDSQNDLIGTTDCLEAVGVLRCWKNFLFVIAVLCILLLQTSFWLVDFGCVKSGEDANVGAAVEVIGEVVADESGGVAVVADANQLVAAADQNMVVKTEDAVAAVVVVPEKANGGGDLFEFTFEKLAGIMRLINFVLIPVSMLYCLTLLFTLKVSLLGRLGGINHICRAVFISLVFMVLVLPWQKFFGGMFVGAIFSPAELLKSCAVAGERQIFDTAFYYLRFVGYGVLVMVLLIFAHVRSCRWSKAILRRLEVI